METNIIYNEECLLGLKKLPDNSVNCCVTSPPYYGLRDYGNPEQIGLEITPEEYIQKLVDVFREVRRVLIDDGTLWVNIGDSYFGSGKGAEMYPENAKKYKQATNKGSLSKAIASKKFPGYKPKDLIGIPWMLAFALRADGWYLRKDIIWNKPNPMPESVRDRCTNSHEYIFHLSKSNKYYYDCDSIMEEAFYDGSKDTRMKGSHKYSQIGITGLNTQTMAARGHERWKMKNGKYLKNKRDVWTVPTNSFKGAHFATYPEKLIVDCIKAGCPENGIVVDPFMGSGTTAIVARKLNRNYIGFELNAEYLKIAKKRIRKELGLFR